MAIAHVQSTSRTANASSTTKAFASPVTIGGLLVVSVATYSGASPTVTVTDSLGTVYTQVNAVTGHTHNLVVVKGFAPGSGANTVTAAVTGGTIFGLAISEFSGVGDTSEASANAFNSSSPSTVAVTTITNGALLYVAQATDDSGDTFTAGAGYTLTTQANGFGAIASEYTVAGAAGAYTASITITGSVGSAPIIVVAFPSGAALHLLVGNPATASLNTGYSQIIASTIAGTAPLTYSITAGTLPTGLTLEASTGSLAGIPLETGSFSVTVQVVDSSASPVTVSGAYIVHVAANADIGPHNMTSDVLPVPFVASASSESRPAWNAFAGLGTGRWEAVGVTGQYLQLDVGAAWRELVVSYTVRAGSNSLELGQSPKSWTVSGSNDASTFTVFSTVADQAAWVVNEGRLFFCDSVIGYRYLRITVSAVITPANGFTTIGRLAFYRPGDHTDSPVVGLTLVAWYSFGWVDYQANAQIFLGSDANPPGGVTQPGSGAILLSDVATAKTSFSYPLNLAGDISGTAIVLDPDGSNVDVSESVVWFTILGTGSGAGGSSGLNEFRVYGVYYRAYYADGSHRYSLPEVAEVELFTAGGVDDEGLAIDLDLDTDSRVWRDFFSPLSTPAYLRISQFGEFFDIHASCNSPGFATVGVPYAHTLTVPGSFAPNTFVITAGSLPTGLVLAETGEITGTPTLAGVFPFSVQVTSDVFSLDVPNEETQEEILSCAITVLSAPVVDISCHDPSRIKDAYVTVLDPVRYQSRRIT